MKFNYWMTILVVLVGTSCTLSSSKSVLVPVQQNNFILVYQPKGDVFFGPDTKTLKEGEWYDNWVPNDHGFIKADDGKWHIFGITHPYIAPKHGDIHKGENASFHAVSTTTNFKDAFVTNHFIDKAKVLPPQDRPNEPIVNHAPYIIKKDDWYYMVYGPSPMRLAVSKDLYEWQSKGNLFHQEGGARDPSLFVQNGKYYMVYCSQNSVLLRESDDMLTWSEPKTIFTSVIYEPESPSLIFHNGTYYLVVCSWDGVWDKKELVGAYQEKSYVLQSDDMFNFGKNSDKQVATLLGHAPELFQDEDGDWYISSAEWPNRGVSVDKITWVEKQ
ncbi:family 43 glycosylhydrolase [Paraglaciecola aquimarina]|uniref:Family 43 glycosylhydrolase n=1 Tax=Paraglaciecola aquimarina TaxID=1235557 RepID=A0ABU3STU4_9ALTE|nr:family 43 glycosylhydrolase [Paraglaciecola aquimarina]MDU0353403.1 family 43 glycosylhydrolase [Paraglaciecola aquimarina]